MEALLAKGLRKISECLRRESRPKVVPVLSYPKLLDEIHSQNVIRVVTVLAMTTYTGLVKLTDQIIETAKDDHQHGTQGIALDNSLLTRLIKQLTSMERFVAVIGTCEDRMHHWIREAGDAGGDMNLFGRARAAYALSERLQRPGKSWRDNGGTIEPA